MLSFAAVLDLVSIADGPLECVTGRQSVILEGGVEGVFSAILNMSGRGGIVFTRPYTSLNGLGGAVWGGAGGARRPTFLGST